MNNEIKIYRQQFNKTWKEKVLPFFTVYEAERKRRLIKMLILFTATLLSLIGAMILYFNDIECLGWGFLGKVLLLPLIIALICIPSFMSFSLKFEIKYECMNRIMKSLGNISWKTPESVISERDLKNSELFAETLNSTSDDSFYGCYKDVFFKVDEVLLSGEGGGTLFKGIAILIKSNKTIKNKTIIANRFNPGTRRKSKPYMLHIIFIIILFALAILCFLASLQQWFCGFLCLWCLGFCAFLIKEYIDKKKANLKIISRENMQKVNLEDSVFDKKYSVYSSDQIEARYLITPSFMERFKNLQTAFGTKNIKCSFFGDNILFAISTNKDLFEIGSLWHPLTDFRYSNQLFEEIISIYMIIDYLKLNENTKI